MRYAFDSLKGLQRLTQDLAKKLYVTGVLIFFGQWKSPVLRTSELDVAAGVLPRIVRASNPIRALGRQRASKVRNFLCRVHGIKKKRHAPVTRQKTPVPVKHNKSKAPKDSPACAVAQPAKSKGTSLGSRVGHRSSFASRRKSNAAGKGKHIPPSGQIDALFRRQLSTGSDPSVSHPDRTALVEDISDEEFEKHSDGHLLQLDNAATPTDRVGQQEVGQENEVQHELCLSPPGNQYTPQDDLIEEHSDDKNSCPQRQPTNVDSLPSPVKHKRNTDRSTGNQAVSLDRVCAQEERIEQFTPLDQESATTELVQEGLMSGNNKKQRSALGSKVDIPCPTSDGNKVDTTRVESCPRSDQNNCNAPVLGPNTDAHCCSYAAVKQDSAFPSCGVQGHYGVISLFDGVSSVVRILKQKLQQPPVAIILAEQDEKLRGLVCAEFGYRSDEQWGYTVDGAACCYIRDVNSILKNDCYLLRQVVSMYPNLKWFIVGGSPCQGLLGLVGSQSRLFFVLLCTIRTMQILVGTASVRFLVENAGSMKPVHYVAFCRLLGLPHEPPCQYIWDLAKHTPFISRKRNFFRNFPDFERVQELPQFFDQNCGPLLDQKCQIIAFAPLLRNRAVHKFGVCHSSWTLYQPHALVWDYSFWGSKEAFSSACRIVSGKIPGLCSDRIVPPPFLDHWKKFIQLLQRKGSHANDFDPLIGPLLPLFNCSTYKLPFRLLTEQEVMNLSGLGDYWTHTSIHDAEKLSEPLIRNMCGNSFHPASISSALGDNGVLRHWIDNEKDSSGTLVAGQHQALTTYTELCDLIQKEIAKNKKGKNAFKSFVTCLITLLLKGMILLN